ncbi:hypothetical protein [Halorarum salinum]|uniref:Peptidase S1 domain-containing protein n=1 Tax=Halorarum salinum TaxID=2743089 RepID=A0A7D5L9Q7_9EURY|nr:hypothetical protein [Halobaculum salinum]QLG61287.1 hypothetical protein HUG12_05875 [Halobaculum salinum]
MSRDPQVSRRKYVKSMGAGATVFGLDRFSFTPKITIPLLRSKQGVVEEEEVPRAWWQHVQTSKRVVEKVREQYSGVKGFKSAYRTISDERIKGYRKKKIAIEIDTEEAPNIPLGSDTPNGPFPEEVNGIGVETRENLNRTASACKNVGHFDPIPGGTGIFNQQGLKATACCKVTYNGSPRLLTVSHMTLCRKEPVYQDSDEQRQIGSIDNLSASQDWATIDLNSDYDLDNTIRLPSGTEYPVNGWITEGGVETYASNGREFLKVGSETGRTKNSILNHYAPFDDDCSNYEKGIDMRNNGANGDSGGPIFLLTDNNTAFILAINQYNGGGTVDIGCSGIAEKNYSGGIAAWYLQNNTPISF